MLLVGKVEAVAWEVMDPCTLVGMDVGCEVATIGRDTTVYMGDDVVMGGSGLIGGGCGSWKMGKKGLLVKGLVVCPWDCSNTQGARVNEV